jgi:chromosome segregation ATPase
MTRRADRRTSSDDNSNNHPRSRQPEPLSYHELKQLYSNARADRTELQETLRTKAQEFEQVRRLYLEEQQKYEEVQSQSYSYLKQYEQAQVQATSYLTQFQEAQTQAQSNLALYQEAHTQFQSYLTLYQSEKTRGDQLLVQFEEVQAERDRYLTLYNESQDELKFERRSKAGIKGWETRRKRENQQLKQEIAEMTVLLRDSLEHKEEAVDSLYAVAERMDRIQRLVDSVDEDSTTNPVGMIQKFQRIWQAVREILAE